MSALTLDSLDSFVTFKLIGALFFVRMKYFYIEGRRDNNETVYRPR